MRIGLFLLVLLATLLGGCGSGDYVRIAGGGIAFNYRYSQAYMILIAEQRRPLPEGATVQALFDVPDSKSCAIVELPVMAGKLTYKLQTEPLLGFTRGGTYKVTLALVGADGKTIESHDTVYTSDEDQSTLPKKPLVEGLEFTPHLENL
jgi:hypothetical protein